jgi:hypothetical protein
MNFTVCYALDEPELLRRWVDRGNPTDGVAPWLH